MDNLSIHHFTKTLQNQYLLHVPTFECVLEKCSVKMKRALEKGMTNVDFDVPEFILGKPVFKLNDCIQFVMFNLIKKGFRVQYTFPHTLHISWNIVDDRKKNNNKPCLMLPIQEVVKPMKSLQLEQATKHIIHKPKQKRKDDSNMFAKIVKQKSNNNKLILDV